MKLEQSFEVAASVDTVWTALIDVQRVAPCLPGAEITEATDDGTYQGTFAVKLGPATASYRGTIRIEDADEATHTATMRASGTDKRGQGGAKATIVSTLAATDGGATRVDVVTDYAITGRLAAFGRGGMIQDVSNRLLREFAECLQSTLAVEQAPPAAGGDQEAAQAEIAVPAGGAGVPTEQVVKAGSTPSVPASAAATPSPSPNAAKPISGLRLMLGVLGDRLRRLFGRARS